MLLAAALAFPAAATPAFVAQDPADVADAEEAWRLAAACTGREPTVAANVPIVRSLPGDLLGTFAGLSTWGGKAPEIFLAPGAPPIVTAHEVAHAWVHGGQSGLVEGRTELLTSCIQARGPERFAGLMEARSDLEGMPDLRTWDAFHMDRAYVAQAYLASFRLFRAIGRVVPPETLWGSEVTDWPRVEERLAAAGPDGARILDVIRGGVETQRAALLDPDLDGLSNLYEALTGTSPDQWDSDGDGWWDGAPAAHPEGAVPLRRGEVPVCLPMVPAGQDVVLVELGGQLGGLDIPTTTVATGPPGMFVTWVTAWTGHPGGVYAHAVGAPLVPNPRCAMRPHVVMRAATDVPEGALASLADAVEADLAVLAPAVGSPSPVRVLLVDGDEPHLGIVDGERVRIPTRLLPAHTTSGPFSHAVAALALVHAVPSSEVAGAAGALARQAWPQEPVAAALGASGYEVGPWARAWRRCPTGWEGLLAGQCPGPG